MDAAPAQVTGNRAPAELTGLSFRLMRRHRVVEIVRGDGPGADDPILMQIVIRETIDHQKPVHPTRPSTAAGGLHLCGRVDGPCHY